MRKPNKSWKKIHPKRQLFLKQIPARSTFRTRSGKKSCLQTFTTLLVKKVRKGHLPASITCIRTRVPTTVQLAETPFLRATANLKAAAAGPAFSNQLQKEVSSMRPIIPTVCSVQKSCVAVAKRTSAMCLKMGHPRPDYDIASTPL